MQFTDMTGPQRMNAYQAIKDHFNLKAQQRDALDAGPHYEVSLLAAHLGCMDVVEHLLRQDRIL